MSDKWMPKKHYQVQGDQGQLCQDEIKTKKEAIREGRKCECASEYHLVWKLEVVKVVGEIK